MPISDVKQQMSSSSDFRPSSRATLLHDVDATVDPLVDRLSRAGMDAGEVARIASVALGRPVTESYVLGRADRVHVARGRLAELSKKPQLAQRTPEWHAARRDLITASDAAQALGCAKFGTQKEFFVKKCGAAEEQKPFDASVPPLKWGVMFEPVASAVYAHLNGGVAIHEFGLLVHDTIPFVGASPDGVTEDGVMLEIKCPWRRKIDGSVPAQYYHQIQGQLEVAGLRECDYFECEFKEAMPDDDCDLPLRFSRGVFLELILLQDRSPSGPESRYVYPPAEAVTWTLRELREWIISARESASEWLAVRERWWRLDCWSTVRVFKDQEFVDDMLVRLGAVWDRVLGYRMDRAAYESDVLSRKRASRPKKDAPQLSTGYAFVGSDAE